MVLHTVDYVAGGVGLAFGVIGVFGHGNKIRGTRAFLGSFSSGGSAVYLGAMAITPLGVVTNVMDSNPLVLFGALLYAAIITVMQFFENLALMRQHSRRAAQPPKPGS